MDGWINSAASAVEPYGWIERSRHLMSDVPLGTSLLSDFELEYPHQAAVRVVLFATPVDAESAARERRARPQNHDRLAAGTWDVQAHGPLLIFGSSTSADMATRISNLGDALSATVPSPAAEQQLPPSVPAPSNGQSVAEDLERLGTLHEKGVLSDVEFAAAKQRVLFGS